jgi:hypothetical protein
MVGDISNHDSVSNMHYSKVVNTHHCLFVEAGCLLGYHSCEQSVSIFGYRICSVVIRYWSNLCDIITFEKTVCEFLLLYSALCNHTTRAVELLKRPEIWTVSVWRIIFQTFLLIAKQVKSKPIQNEISYHISNKEPLCRTTILEK